MLKFDHPILGPIFIPTINPDSNTGPSPEQIFQRDITKFSNLTDEALFLEIERRSEYERLPFEMIKELKRRQAYTRSRLTAFECTLKTQTKDVAGINEVLCRILGIEEALGKVIPDKSSTKVINPLLVLIVMCKEKCTYKEAEKKIGELIDESQMKPKLK